MARPTPAVAPVTGASGGGIRRRPVCAAHDPADHATINPPFLPVAKAYLAQVLLECGLALCGLVFQNPKPGVLDDDRCLVVGHDVLG